MSRVPLVSGAYQARSLIAGAQRCVNLYPEENPDPQAPVPVTHYPTPGLTPFGQASVIGTGRGVYRTTTGEVFSVVGTSLYAVEASGLRDFVGTIADRLTPVSMSDNGLVLILVDGSTTGYAFDLVRRLFAKIADPNFQGADRVDYIDTYFVLNVPGTGQFYISLSLVSYAMLTNTASGSAFDGLDVARKIGSADDLVSVISVHGVLWLIGALTSEIWYNSGAADFTFERQPGAFIEHGCIAPYSVAKQDISVFWLSQDREGHGIVVRGSGYGVERISTHAIEAAIQGYTILSDAVGFCFQQQGHAFYVITFPKADVTWAYELKTEQWHQQAWADTNGALHRHRASFCCFAYDKNLVMDWQTGALYWLDPDNYTDNGNPIVRIRTFPHMIKDGKRITYRSMIIDMQTGTTVFPASDVSGILLLSGGGGELLLAGGAGGLLFTPTLASGTTNFVSLRWSDTRGATWSNPITQDIGSAGDYTRSLIFNRLGMARDRVFEISWSSPLRTALNGAFVEIAPHGS